MRFERGSRRPRRPSLTPLIDVVFLLLIFFMLASRFHDLGAFAVDAAAAQAAGKPEERTVEIDLRDDGRIELAGAAVEPDALVARVAALAGGHADASVVVLPEPAVPLAQVVSVLEHVRRAGVANVTVARRTGG